MCYLKENYMNKEELVNTIEKHKKLYRNGELQISDEEYDHLLKQLESIDPNHSLVTTVEEEYFDDKPTVKHPFPMLSTDKAYSEDELKKFFNRIEKKFGKVRYKVTPKLDGLAGRYSNGVLVTRGDGTTGYDISDAFEKGLRVWGKLGSNNVLGEIVMDEEYFNQYLSGVFKHPRNVVVGGVKCDTLGWQQAVAFDNGAVYFVPYDNLPCQYGDSDTIVSHFETITTNLSQIPFRIDGFVIEITDDYKDVKEQLGHTSHHYRWQIAFKEQSEIGVTTVNKITPQTGRGGNITPVLEVEPVTLSGAVVKRVTAHNYGNLKKEGIGECTKISITRSGEVIPKVLGVVEGKKENVIIPSTCPSCNTHTVLVKDILKCPNFSCPAQVVGRLQHFFKTLKIDLFGSKTIEKLVDNGYLTPVDILVDLDNKELIKMGFGDKQSVNLMDSIDNCLLTTYEDWKVLASLSIPMLGKGDAKKLCKVYTIEELLECGTPNIEEIEGFGEKKSSSIVEGLKDNQGIIRSLLEYFTIEQTKQKSNNNIFEGKIFVFTGKMHMSREDMKKMCEELGGEAKNSISTKTDYLVTGENVGQSKLTKAKNYGTKVISEDDFMKMLG